MSGLELDHAFRKVLATAKPETILTDTRKLTALGIGARTAFLILCSHLEPSAPTPGQEKV